MTNRPFFASPAARVVAPGLAVMASAFALAGCGSVGNTSSSRIRSVDAATNAQTANILVNAASAYGDQTNFSVSPYLYISTGQSTFSYNYTAPNPTLQVPDNTTIPTLSSGKFYSAYLVGRADAAVTTPTNPKYLHVLVTDDSHSIPSGQAVIRLIDAAPDAGNVDVLVNGALPDPSFGNVAYAISNAKIFPAPYVAVAPGILSVRVNATGTGNAIIPATGIPVVAGKAYTILVTEPIGGGAATSTTPATQSTYALQTTTE